MAEVPSINPREEKHEIDIDLSDGTVPEVLAYRGTERTAADERNLVRQYRAMQSQYLGLAKAYRDLQENIKREGITFAGFGLKKQLLTTYAGYFKEFDLYASVDEATLIRELEECAENDAFTQKIAYLDTLIEASYERLRRMNEQDGTVANRAREAADLAADIAAERASAQQEEAAIIRGIFRRTPSETVSPSPVAPASVPVVQGGLWSKMKKFFG